MGKNLLSIDWDYFIPIKKEWCGSYIENKRNIISIWYRRYMKAMFKGKNIEKTIKTGKVLNNFWHNINKVFDIDSNSKIYVSDSHKVSYHIAKDNSCDRIITFDAHSDLGYGGMKSLNFEVNCANWLGKCLKEKVINEAEIIYSPYTYETKKQFKEINNNFHIYYPNLEGISSKYKISVIHICRSGAWTPPWLDYEFYRLIKEAELPYEIINCPKRIWKPKNLTLSEKLDCLYS